MQEDLYQTLLNAAFRFISFRPRSEAEISAFLQQKLKKWKTASRYTFEKVLNRLKDYGYIDDEKFALWWIHQRRSFRPKGERMIRQELLKKGVPKHIVMGVIDRVQTESGNELENAKNALRKKAVLLAKLPIIEQKKKTYTFLAQRGFSPDTIGVIIDDLSKND